jgi:hypothetical protein
LALKGLGHHEMILYTVRQWQGILTNETPLTLREATAASQSTFIINQLQYTPLVISKDRLK